MKSLIEIKKEADKCADLKNATNKIRCLKNKLINEINGDKDILLYYKTECKKNTGFDSISFSISVSAFIISLVNFIKMMSESYISDSQNNIVNKQELWETVLVNATIVFIFIMIIYVSYSAIRYVLHQEKYKVIDVVLQEISNDWEELF